MSMNVGPSWLITHLGLKHPAIALCACIGAGVYAFYPVNEIPQNPMVSFTFDDGWHSTLIAKEILSEHDMNGTAYIITEMIGNSSYMNSDEVVELSVDNWEIGSHTISHPYLTELEYQTMVHEIQYPARYLSDMIGLPIFSFSSPYGDYSDDVIGVASLVYDSHVNAWSDHHGINRPEDFDPMNIHRLDITSDKTPEDVCNIINSLENDEWFVMIFHQMVDDEPQRLWEYPVSSFEYIVNCVNELEIDVVTITEGADRIAS